MSTSAGKTTKAETRDEVLDRNVPGTILTYRQIFKESLEANGDPGSGHQLVQYLIAQAAQSHYLRFRVRRRKGSR